MPARSEVRPHLDRILADEFRLLAELERLLHAETVIVDGDDVEAIQNMGTARHRCVDALSRLEMERNDLCRVLFPSAGRDGFAQLLRTHDPDQGLRGAWMKNLTAARRCKQINDRNGAVVIAKLGRVQQLLGALRGTSAPPVYTAKGSRLADFGRRELGRA
jgi:flagellar biosynthesis/type III secretory pathway chaperone